MSLRDWVTMQPVMLSNQLAELFCGMVNINLCFSKFLESQLKRGESYKKRKKKEKKIKKDFFLLNNK